MTKRILVTGKNGQLGRSLQKVTRNPSNFFKIKSEHFDCSEEFITSEWDFNFVSRDELDLSNSESINEFFKLHQFAGIINCAAYTSVDKAESEVELAEQINHFAVGQLAEIAKKQAIPLIHISTDYVFPGKGLKPYNETDETEPLNIYGVTKLKGEQVLTASGCTGAIIRTSWLYSEFGKNFVKTMLGLAKDQDSISVVIDQVGSPTYATNLAKVILAMLSKHRTIEILNSQLNVYNFTDEGICSWYDFAKAIFQLSDISCKVNPVETKDYPSCARRPHFNVMNKDKIKYHLPDLETPYWRESLAKCLANIKKKNLINMMLNTQKSSLKILVTGGAGFIGSALLRYIINDTNYSVVNIDKLTYAGNLQSLKSISKSSRYIFEQVDICDSLELTRVFNFHQPDIVMHLAAESHVDRSIDGPGTFIQTNIVGTYTLLEQVRTYWTNLQGEKKNRFRFHHVSTDEVYGDLPHPDDHAIGLPLFTENTSYKPSSPYSASKASSDHLVRSWFKTYGLPILITNCSNNYGPYHFPEKLIPLIILNAIEGKKLPVYGKGNQIRDWLHVEDHVRALVLVATKGRVGETYNIGGHNEIKNIEVVKTICMILEELVPLKKSSLNILNYESLIMFVKDRPGHDRRYAIDASKIQKELSWTPKETFESGIRKTVQWYLDNQTWWQHVQDGSYQRERLGV